MRWRANTKTVTYREPLCGPILWQLAPIGQHLSGFASHASKAALQEQRSTRPGATQRLPRPALSPFSCICAYAHGLARINAWHSTAEHAAPEDRGNGSLRADRLRANRAQQTACRRKVNCLNRQLVACAPTLWSCRHPVRNMYCGIRSTAIPIPHKQHCVGTRRDGCPMCACLISRSQDAVVFWPPPISATVLVVSQPCQQPPGMYVRG